MCATVMNISNLPEDIIFHIGSFLKPQDLLTLSATCRRLRSILNANHVWRQHTEGGYLGRALDHAVSVVPAIFTSLDYEESSLEHLCENRNFFLKQSRLLSNFRQNKCQRHCIPFKGFLSDFQTSTFSSFRQITFKDIYLFSLNYDAANWLAEGVEVFNIQDTPHLLTTFKLIQHSPLHTTVWLDVVENLLVVRLDNWFDVYHIKLPCLEFPLLHTINVELSLFDLAYSVLIQNFLLATTCSIDSSLICVWDIKTKTRLPDILPKTDKSVLKMCSHNWNQKTVLILEKSVVKPSSKLFLFDLNSMQYKDFCPLLPPTTDLDHCFFLFDSYYVVLIDKYRKSISVYETISSTMLAKRKHVEMFLYDKSFIINSSLVLPTLLSIKVMELKTLNITCELNFNCGSLLRHTLSDVHSFNIFGLCHLIVMTKSNYQAEVWHFEKKKKCFDLLGPDIRCLTLNDTRSKFIILKGLNVMEILSFW